MKSIIASNAKVTIGYAKLLVNDLRDDQMTAQPIAGKVMNHAAWVIGHLAFANDTAAKMLSYPAGVAVEFDKVRALPGTAPAAWAGLFGPKSVPQADAKIYPSKAELLAALDAAHAAALAALDKVTPEQLANPMPEPMNKRFAQIGQMGVFIMTAHNSLHSGQLSAWRRALGLPSVM